MITRQIWLFVTDIYVCYLVPSELSSNFWNFQYICDTTGF